MEPIQQDLLDLVIWLKEMSPMTLAARGNTADISKQWSP